MAYFASLWKARIIEKHRQEYENEKIISLYQSNTKVPKDSGLKWRMYGYDTKRRMSGRLKKMFPDGSKISNLWLYLKTDQTFPNFLLKSLIGFLGGILLTYLGFMFFVFQLSISLVHATIMSSIIGVLLTLGLAFSYRIRCLVFLLIPQFFSRIGRYTLTCYALILILTGPATNTLRNSEVLTESMACSQEQIKADVRHLTDSMKNPFNAFKDSIQAMLGRINRVNDEVEGVMRNIERLVVSIADVIQSSYNWLNEIVHSCNRRLGTPYEHCMTVLKEGIPNCVSTLGPNLSWLCNVTTIESACEIVKSYNEICYVDEFVKASFAATIRRKLRDFTARFKRVFHAGMQVHHRFTISNANRSANQIAAGIITEIRNRADPLLTWLSWSSCITSLFLLLIIFRAKYYQHMYETRSRFDNCYVTKELYELDWKRFQEGRDTILPLNRRERAKYIPTTSFRLVATEKIFISRSAVFMAITTFKLMIHMVADYSLYWVLTTIRYHGRFQAFVPPGPPDAGIKISGSGFGADMLRSILNILTVPLHVPASSPIACLPNPHPPDFQRYTQIGVLIVLLWLFALFEPYGLRLRHVIMGHYRPERAKARATWLYHHILRTRGSFMKLARRKLHREYKYSSEEHLTFRHWVDSHLPCYFLRRLFGTLPKAPHCLLCETKETPQDCDTKLIRCETPTCLGTFCSSCFNDIGELCTICMSPADYGDYSDISLEKGSSEDDSDDQYDTNECKDDSSKDHIKLRLIRSKPKEKDTNVYSKNKMKKYFSYYTKSKCRHEYDERTPLAKFDSESISDNNESNGKAIEIYANVNDGSKKTRGFPKYNALKQLLLSRQRKSIQRNKKNASKHSFIVPLAKYFKIKSKYKSKIPKILRSKRKRQHRCGCIKLQKIYGPIFQYFQNKSRICNCLLPTNNNLMRYYTNYTKVATRRKRSRVLNNKKKQEEKVKNSADGANDKKCRRKRIHFLKKRPFSLYKLTLISEDTENGNGAENKKENTSKRPNKNNNKKSKKKEETTKGKQPQGVPKSEDTKSFNLTKSFLTAFSTCICRKHKTKSVKLKQCKIKKQERTFRKNKNNFKRRKKKDITKSHENLKIKQRNEIARNYRLTTYLQDQCWNTTKCPKFSNDALANKKALDDLVNLRMVAAKNKVMEAELLKILKNTSKSKTQRCNCPQSSCICANNQMTCSKCNKPKKKSFFRFRTDACLPKKICCKNVRRAEIDQAVSTSIAESKSDLIKVHDLEKPLNKGTDPYSPKRMEYFKSTGSGCDKTGQGLKLYNFLKDTKICEDPNIPISYGPLKGATTKKNQNKMTTSIKSFRIKDIKLVLSEQFLHLSIKNPAPLIKNMYKSLKKSCKTPHTFYRVKHEKGKTFGPAPERKTVFPVVQSSSCQYVGEMMVQDRGTQMRQNKETEEKKPHLMCDAEVGVTNDTCTCATQCKNSVEDKSCCTDACLKTEHCTTTKKLQDNTISELISSDFSISTESPTDISHSDDTKTDTTICSRLAVDLIDETPIRLKHNKYIKKIKVNVVTKHTQGTMTNQYRLCDTSTCTEDWWSPMVEKKPIKCIVYPNEKTRKPKLDKGVTTDRQRIVKFLSRAQIIPREDILSPSRYLLESQRYYNELFSSQLFAPHVFPALVARKENEKLLFSKRHNNLRKNRKAKRLEEYISPRLKSSNMLHEKHYGDKARRNYHQNDFKKSQKRPKEYKKS